METIVRLYIPNPDKKTAWLTKTSRNQVEYIRADVFIEKACDAFCKVRCKGKPPRSNCTSLGTCREHDDFKKYMEEGV